MKLSQSLLKARQHAGLTQGALAMKSGVKQQVIAKIERDGQRSTSYVPQLAQACGLTVEQFLSGDYSAGLVVRDGDPEYTLASSDRVRVPYYPDVPISAGHGCLPLDEANIAVIEMSRNLLERCGVSPADAALLQSDGDSMKGVIDHGDLMVVDLSAREIREGRIFVVSVDGELLVKKIQRIPKGIKLVSENPAYDPITILDDDQDVSVRLIGRVAMSWSMTGFLQ